MANVNKSEELQDRIKVFIFTLLKVLRQFPKTQENLIYEKQIIRSASSIGANYAEAVYAQTRQEFLHCVNISRKEANETLYWLELLYNANPASKNALESLIDENKQLLKIFVSSVITIRRNIKNDK